MGRRLITQNRGSFAPRAERRKSVWFQFVPSEITLAGPSVAALFFSLNAAALALRPFTVVRTRGVFGVRSDQSGASEDYSGSLGIAVVSEQASAIGVTAVPTPETDRASDLFFTYESLAGFLQRDSAVGMEELGKWKDIDSKAMRKVDIGQDLVVTVETSAISLGAIVHFSARMLVKLH